MNKTGRKTDLATGHLPSWCYGKSRIMVTFSEQEFSEVKIAAMKNGNSISTEIRTRVLDTFDNALNRVPVISGTQD